VFGTFVYGGGPGRKAKGGSGSGRQNVSPVGVMWGNDPSYKPGHGELQQTALNPAVHMSHLGYQGRLNAPVDNAVSSSMSCHSTAELPQGTMVPPKGADPVVTRTLGVGPGRNAAVVPTMTPAEPWGRAARWPRQNL
jgi:hypothetical protein